MVAVSSFCASRLSMSVMELLLLLHCCSSSSVATAAPSEQYYNLEPSTQMIASSSRHSSRSYVLRSSFQHLEEGHKLLLLCSISFVAGSLARSSSNISSVTAAVAGDSSAAPRR